MEIKKIDLREIENKYETNPFILELKGKMFLQPRANTIIAKGQQIVDTITGEVLEESVLIGRRKIVDKSQFAKIYASEIATLYELSKPAQTVFLYLTKVMDYDNKAYINAERDCKKVGYNSGKSIIKGLKELIKNDIIAPHIIGGVYWLNPKIVCKGERFAKYTEYVVGTPEEVMSQEALLKKQGRSTFEQLPKSVEKKVKRANQSPIIDGDLFSTIEQTNPYTAGNEKN